MADVNWKSIGGISLIGGIIGYVSAWNKERRYRNYLVNKFGVFDAEGFTPYQYDSNDERLKMGRAVMDDFRKTFSIDHAKDSLNNEGRIRFYLTDEWHYNPEHPNLSDFLSSKETVLDNYVNIVYYQRLDDDDERFVIKTDLEGVPLFRRKWMNTDTEESNIRYEQWKQRIQKKYPMFSGMLIKPYHKYDDVWPEYFNVHLQFKPPSKNAESFSAESQFGDPEWKTKVHAKYDGKPSPYDGKLSWDISYYTPLGITFHGDISKDPQRKHEGYTVLINCDNLGGCGGSKRMSISPKILDLYKFKTMPQVKKAFKKFIDDLFTGKMKCQDGGETLTGETIAHCVGCETWEDNMTRNGYVCHHHIYTSDKIPPLIVYDDGRTLKSYDCKKHTKEAIWQEENPNNYEYEVGGLTISDSDLIPKEKFVNPRERRIRQRFGLGAETFEAEKQLKLPLSFSTHNVNSAMCISANPHFGSGLCYDESNHKVDGTGNIRGSHGEYGYGEPTCIHCKQVWHKMSIEEKGAWKQAFVDWNDEYDKDISFEAPMKGAQPRRGRYEVALPLDKTHTSAIRKALKDNYKDFNFSVKMNGNTTIVINLKSGKQEIADWDSMENEIIDLAIDTIWEMVPKGDVDSIYGGFNTKDEMGIDVYCFLGAFGNKEYIVKNAESKKTNKMGDLVYDALYSPDSEIYQYIDAIHEHEKKQPYGIGRARSVNSVNIIVFRTYLEGKAKTLERIGADTFNKKSIIKKVKIVNMAHKKSRKQQGAYLRALKQWIKDNTIYDYDIYKNANACVSYKDKVLLAWGGYSHEGATIKIEFTQAGDAKFDEMRDRLPKEKRKEVVRIQYGAESKKTNEMDKFFEWILKENPTSRQTTKPYSRKVDYLAQRYSDEELKAGLVNAYNAGDIDNAKLFAAALGRQGFISKYQAERKVY